MKVAVCISGQPRSYREGYEYLERNLLSKYDCDVFIHTWANPFVIGSDLDSLYGDRLKGIKVEVNPFDRDALNAKYTNTYDAMKFPPYATISSFYSIYKCMLLKQVHEINTVEYDWVVRTRFDYALNREFDLDELGKCEKMLYVPDCRQKMGWPGINDQFALGCSSIMNIYASTFMWLDHLYYLHNVQMIGEDMLIKNLVCHGVESNIVPIDMNNPFPPGSHNGTPHSLIRDDINQWKNL